MPNFQFSRFSWFFQSEIYWSCILYIDSMAWLLVEYKLNVNVIAKKWCFHFLSMLVRNFKLIIKTTRKIKLNQFYNYSLWFCSQTCCHKMYIKCSQRHWCLSSLFNIRNCDIWNVVPVNLLCILGDLIGWFRGKYVISLIQKFTVLGKS